MKAKFGLAVLLLSVLFWTPGGPGAPVAGSRLQPLQSALLQPASVTVPPEAPVVVDSGASMDNRGWAGSVSASDSTDLTDDVLAAYTLAVAVSPTECHLTTPLLAAIGQVESGNLAGHTLDGHRVKPGILGPVLDGKKYGAVADTDGGTWDGDKKWDRALGPMQIIPASWRVVGLDMDGDGVRDPQNIYDAAGAAMVYLCAGGRDLSSAEGLAKAIRSYNDSDAYLKAVLGWKSIFDQADLTGIGAVPFVAALTMPLTTALPTPAHASPSPTSATAAENASQPVRGTTATPSAGPTGSAAPSGSTTPAAPSSTGTTPGVPGTTPADPTPADPTPSDPAPADPTPSDPPPVDPTPADPTPTDPTPTDPTPLPECPVPTDEATDPAAEPPADAPVVSPETCTPPEGYVFDPDTGELVLEPVASPAP
jgi:hypothetical protein